MELTSDRVACNAFFGYRRALRRDLKFDRRVSANVVSGMFVPEVLELFLEKHFLPWSGGLG